MQILQEDKTTEHLLSPEIFKKKFLVIFFPKRECYIHYDTHRFNKEMHIMFISTSHY